MGDQFLGLRVTGEAGDVFADEALSFDIINGTLRISFVVVRNAEPAPPCEYQFEHVGRLILPLESGQKLCLGLYDFLKNAGFDPGRLASEGQTPQ